MRRYEVPLSGDCLYRDKMSCGGVCVQRSTFLIVLLLDLDKHETGLRLFIYSCLRGPVVLLYRNS